MGKDGRAHARSECPKQMPWRYANKPGQGRHAGRGAIGFAHRFLDAPELPRREAAASPGLARRLRALAAREIDQQGRNQRFDERRRGEARRDDFMGKPVHRPREGRFAKVQRGRQMGNRERMPSPVRSSGMEHISSLCRPPALRQRISDPAGRNSIRPTGRKSGPPPSPWKRATDPSGTRERDSPKTAASAPRTSSSGAGQ